VFDTPKPLTLGGVLWGLGDLGVGVWFLCSGFRGVGCLCVFFLGPARGRVAAVGGAGVAGEQVPCFYGFFCFLSFVLTRVISSV